MTLPFPVLGYVCALSAATPDLQQEETDGCSITGRARKNRPEAAQ